MNRMYVAPETGGIHSVKIREYLQALQEAELSVHSIIIGRGNDILFEKYFSPFTADFRHRIYSETKSFVGIAMGFAEQEGLVKLDDPISKYFPKECENLRDKKMGEQTIRQMLMMSTPKNHSYWFDTRTDDRVLEYFQRTTTKAPLGSKFDYDSSGSFVLGAMIERLTGKSFLDYLQEKLFDNIGIERDDVQCLLSPGGHSWADSGMLVRPRDMFKVIRFLLDNGRANGKQVLNEKYIAEATGKLIGTADQTDDYCRFGYGYLIWRTYENSFFFNGMGAQYAVGCPEKDLIFIFNADAQGMPEAKKIILTKFFEMVYPNICESLSENKSDFEELTNYCENLTLYCEKGKKTSPIAEKVSGKTFTLRENKMGIKKLKFTFSENRGILEYENAQGLKLLAFGMCENCFTVFPEEGYSRKVGSVYAKGNYYKCANSAAWKSETQLLINVQVIDEYFGRLWMTFNFENENISLNMRKSAEDFFQTYEGEANGSL